MPVHRRLHLGPLRSISCTVVFYASLHDVMGFYWPPLMHLICYYMHQWVRRKINIITEIVRDIERDYQGLRNKSLHHQHKPFLTL